MTHQSVEARRARRQTSALVCVTAAIEMPERSNGLDIPIRRDHIDGTAIAPAATE
jgi:hypothetical protein